MKKIFTFLISFFAITSLFAQSNRWNNSRDDRSGNQSYSNHNSGSSYDKSHGSGYYDNNSYTNRDNQYGDRSNGYHSDYNTGRYSEYNNGRNEAWGHESGRDARYGRDYDVRRNSNSHDRDERVYRSNVTSGTLKAVGAGLIIGGIVAILAGSH